MVVYACDPDPAFAGWRQNEHHKIIYVLQNIVPGYSRAHLIERGMDSN